MPPLINDYYEKYIFGMFAQIEREITSVLQFLLFNLLNYLAVLDYWPDTSVTDSKKN